MKFANARKALFAAALIGAGTLGAIGMAHAQYGGYGMGNGGMGGYGRGMMGGNGGGMMGGYGPGSPNGYQGNPQQGYPDLNTPAGRLFAQTCSQCHTLPDPRQHTAAQWPSVVARMELRMRQSNMPLPGEREIKDIDTFLEQYTSGKE
jgi:mono/diheme cytochrome c family protein